MGARTRIGNIICDRYSPRAGGKRFRAFRNGKEPVPSIWYPLHPREVSIDP